MQYKLEYHIMTEYEKQLVCSWKYPEEYALYNLPSYDEMKAKKIGFLIQILQKIIIRFTIRIYMWDSSIF